jgi:hypothetical protein
MTRRKIEQHHKEKLTHKIALALLSSMAAAIVAGLLGYRLNIHSPELYFDASPRPASTLRGYRVDTTITNLGNSAATELVIRYSFDYPILAFDYDYSEGWNGRLPSANISGGVSEKELLLTPPRLLPKDKLEAHFLFAYPFVATNIKVFSRETMGKPLKERVEQLTRRAEFWHKIGVFVQNFFYRLRPPATSSPEQKEKLKQ